MNLKRWQFPSGQNLDYDFKQFNMYREKKKLSVAGNSKGKSSNCQPVSQSDKQPTQLLLLTLLVLLTNLRGLTFVTAKLITDIQ